MSQRDFDKPCFLCGRVGEGVFCEEHRADLPFSEGGLAYLEEVIEQLQAIITKMRSHKGRKK